jgi:hypothetical protein
LPEVLRPREKELPSRGGAGQSRRGLETVDEVVPVLLVVQEQSHPAQGAAVL